MQQQKYTFGNVEVLLVKRRNEHGTVSTAAVASGILSVTVQAEPIVKEYDVYVLAIAGAPSLWQPLPALRAQLRSTAEFAVIVALWVNIGWSAVNLLPVLPLDGGHILITKVG